MSFFVATTLKIILKFGRREVKGVHWETSVTWSTIKNKIKKWKYSPNSRYAFWYVLETKIFNIKGYTTENGPQVADLLSALLLSSQIAVGKVEAHTSNTREMWWLTFVLRLQLKKFLMYQDFLIYLNSIKWPRERYQTFYKAILLKLQPTVFSRSKSDCLRQFVIEKECYLMVKTKSATKKDAY